MCPTNPPHRKRCRRSDVAGHAHYLTFPCFRRQPFLTRDRTRRRLLEAIQAAGQPLPEILEKVCYIHKNPLRRGLVDKPEQ